jgi:hypothetical protein
MDKGMVLNENDEIRLLQDITANAAADVDAVNPYNGSCSK